MIMTNHARTKRNLKKYREKLFRKRWYALRNKDEAKLKRLSKPVGITVKLRSEIDKAANHARYVSWDYQPAKKNWNQKKIRKLWRQCPHLRKAA